MAPRLAGALIDRSSISPVPRCGSCLAASVSVHRPIGIVKSQMIRRCNVTSNWPGALTLTG